MAQEDQRIVRADLYPDRAQYRPGSHGRIVLELESSVAVPAAVVKAVGSSLHRAAWTHAATVSLSEGGATTVIIPFETPQAEWACFGVDVEVTADGGVLYRGSTAYDAADHWRRAPRYGFLSDFPSGEAGRLEDAEAMNKYHLNVIQFYDWMYRHDELLPPTDRFTDPMGRSLDFAVAREKIAALHERGMAAMAYGAVYAALKDFLAAHPEWGLYRNDGESFQLIDLFYIMDISPDSEWTSHIAQQFRRAVEAGFDGIHMDQYGFPKIAYRRRPDGSSETVDLASCYGPLIDRAKREVTAANPEAGLIFNNVSGYPVHATAGSDQEAVYIEVWPPVVHYRELKGLIDRARVSSGGKAVILSAYLPAFHPKCGVPAVQAERGAYLTMASIFASGGYHLLLGEANKVLTAAYYPDYGPMSDGFIAGVRRYYDFIVRFGELLYDAGMMDVSMTYTGGINSEIRLEGESPFEPNGDLGTVWTIAKTDGRRSTLQLINLVGLDNDLWERGKDCPPRPQSNIVCTWLLEYEPEGIYWASPDFADSRSPQPLPYEIVDHEQGKAARFSIPRLSYWTLVYVQGKRDSGEA